MKENSYKMVWEPSHSQKSDYLWASDGGFYNSPKTTHRSTLLEPICIFTLETYLFAESCNARGKIFLRGKVKTDFKNMCLNIFEEKNPTTYLLWNYSFFPIPSWKWKLVTAVILKKKKSLIDMKLDFPVYVLPFSFNLWKFLNLVLKHFFPGSTSIELV